MKNRIITREEIEKINALNDSVKGTSEYNKYTMPSEFKWKKNDKWTSWRFGGWTNHIFENSLTVKKVKDKIYLVSEKSIPNYYPEMNRYEVTGVIKEVLGL